MALTRDFKETVKARADRDPEFRNGLLRIAIEALVCGEFEVAKMHLRDYVNATEGFIAVGEAIGKSEKSVMRMLSDDGNPNARNLFELTSYLQGKSGLSFSVVAEKPRKRKTTQRKAAQKTVPIG